MLTSPSDSAHDSPYYETLFSDRKVLRPVMFLYARGGTNISLPYGLTHYKSRLSVINHQLVAAASDPDLHVLDNLVYTCAPALFNNNIAYYAHVNTKVHEFGHHLRPRTIADEFHHDCSVDVYCAMSSYANSNHCKFSAVTMCSNGFWSGVQHGILYQIPPYVSEREEF